MADQDENHWLNYGVRILFNTVSHPLEYAKVLIQIGYEPIAPVPTKTFFGKPALKLPNIFQYVKYIKSVDGVAGCYRGLGTKVCGNLVSAVTSQYVLKYMELDDDQEDDNKLKESDEIDEEERKIQFIKSFKKDFVSRVTTIIISHPFHVITVRMMAQFITGDGQYTGALRCITDIYKNNGIFGFFSGLIPRLLGEVLTLATASALCYVFNTYVFEEKELQGYATTSMSFVATTIMYPFQVVANCMAVSNSGLPAGSPPYMPHYSSWMNCWSDLARRNQLKRGSSLFIRYYVGPQVLISGRAVPIKDGSLQFGY